jgi:putative heme transporter
VTPEEPSAASPSRVTTPRKGTEIHPTSVLSVAPGWLRFLGINGWLFVGVIGAIVIVAWFFAATATILVPLILAVMMGVVFAPLVGWLENHRVPRWLGAAIGLLVVLGVIGGAIWLVISSVVSQWPQLSRFVTQGIEELQTWLGKQSVPADTVDKVTSAVTSGFSSMAKGALVAVSSGVSNTISLVLGAFLAFYMLYLVLADYAHLKDWVASHLGLPEKTGAAIVSDSVHALRGYFRGATIIGFINAVPIALAMWILHVPLVGTVAILTVVLGYIPFFGALISGALAVIIALGSQGLDAALWMLVVVLVSQNLLQMPVSSWALGDALELHPIVVLVSTMIGGIFGGLFGSMLGTPLTAIAVRMVGRIREANAEIEAGGTSAAPSVAEDG